MRDMSLIEAWRVRLSGRSIHGLTLWSLELVWWGRIGKLMAIAGVSSVVAHIGGTARLRAVAKFLRLHLIEMGRSLIGQWVQAWSMWDLTEGSDAWSGDDESPESVIAGLLITVPFLLVFLAISVVYVWATWRWMWAFLLWIVFFALVLFMGFLMTWIVLGPPVLALAAILTLLGLLADFTIRTMAWV
jgi:hypothetical protein